MFSYNQAPHFTMNVNNNYFLYAHYDKEVLYGVRKKRKGRLRINIHFNEYKNTLV